VLERAISVVLATALSVAACSGDTTQSSNGDAAAGSAGSGGAGGSTAGSGGSGASSGRGGSAGATGGGAGSGGGGNAGTAGAGATGGDAGSGGTNGASGSAGRDAGVPDAPISCPDGGTPDASAEDAIRASCTVAVVQVSRLDEECSGLGGTHVTFTVIAVGRGTPVTVLSHGGHGYFAGTTGPRAVGEYFVVGVDAFGRLIARPDNGGWCITGLPDVDGHAHTLLRASSEADARTKMRGLLG
jgi:hypothetical protein